MLFGHTSLNKCPICDNLIAVANLHGFFGDSSNDYSDGYNSRIHSSESNSISKCSNCDSIYLKADAVFVGSYGSDIATLENKEDIPKPWKDAKITKSLDIYDHFLALETNVVKKLDDEYSVRHAILWLFNDRVRNGKNYTESELFKSKTDKALWTKNNLRLIDILDDSNNKERLLKAELYRNLGEFDKCLQIIHDKSFEGHGSLKMQYRLECKVKNTLVFQLENNYR